LRTTYALGRHHTAFLQPFGLTPTQYNALRILAGAHPEPLPCREIGRRMVTPVPDVTRLVERLEAKGLAARRRPGRDRRVVAIGITPAGRRLLAVIEEPLAAWLESRLGHLGRPGLERLSRLLERLREPPAPPPG
jgi:DNA-binding MarR family transcriptional regulator